MPTLDPQLSLEVLEDIGAATYAWDIATDRLAWSPGAERLLGVSSLSEIATGRRYARMIDPAGPSGRYDVIFRSQDTDRGAGVPFVAEYRFLPPGTAESLWLEDCGRWLPDSDGRPVRAHGLLRVVNDRRAREERLIFRSEHDELTGGLNRTRLSEELAAAIERAERDRSSCAFAAIAVDNLGPLNDAYGFDVGDELVAGVAARLAATMRRGDVLGRLSGNKIGAVLNSCGESALRAACDRFVRVIGDTPLTARCGAIAITVSIGGVVLPRYGRTVGESLARAQEALSAARRRGVAGQVIYNPAPDRERERQRNISMAAEVIDALNAGRVELALQPIVAAHSRQPVLYEGLCRLNTEEGVLIRPREFIETVERLGIIRLVDHRTLDLAVAALAEDRTLNLSINVSVPTAMDGAWFARLAAHVRRDRDLPARLVVEITETMAIADLPRATEFVRSLRDLGCRVAIDDFGAGHTSLRSLRALAADLVKIDGSFVENIADNTDDRLFIDTLVKLARHMGMETVAERVCDEREARVLCQAGVGYLQGHLFGEARIRPRPQASPDMDISSAGR